MNVIQESTEKGQSYKPYAQTNKKAQAKGFVEPVLMKYKQIISKATIRMQREYQKMTKSIRGFIFYVKPA